MTPPDGRHKQGRARAGNSGGGGQRTKARALSCSYALNGTRLYTYCQADTTTLAHGPVARPPTGQGGAL